MRLAITKHAKQALSLLEAVNVPAELKEKLTTQDQSDEAGIKAQRENVAALKAALAGATDEASVSLRDEFADYLVKKSVWIFCEP
nr:hypothetical protein [Fibrobacter sp. UWR2]